MNIPSCIDPAPGAKTATARLACPIAAGKGADRGGGLIPHRRPASHRKPDLRGGGVER